MEQRLLAAVRAGDEAGLRRVLAEGADVEVDCSAGQVRASPSRFIPSDGWRALHHAAFAGLVGVGRLLLAAGARGDPVARFGATPLVEAARMGHAEFVDLLLEHGASPDPRALAEATPHPACVARLLAAGADPTPAIHATVIYGRAASLRLLLEAGADPRGTRAAHPDGRIVASPRMTALRSGHDACVALLAGRPPYASLSDAVTDGNLAAAASFVAAGASVEEVETYGFRPLWWAIRAGQVDAVTWLLERGAQLAQAGTPHDGAAQAGIASGSLAMLELLRHQGVSWRGVLRAAVAHSEAPVLRWLLAHVPIDAADARHAVSLCAAGDRAATLRLLVEHGLPIDGALATAARHHAAAVFDLLLSRGADPHAELHGQTLLDLALEGADWEVEYTFSPEDLEEPFVRRLLEMGVRSKWLAG